MRTEIVFLLDRSGSMHGLVDDTIGGFNSLIADQKKVEGEVVVTLSQFDGEFQTDFEGIPLVEVPELDRTTYVPRGSTALLDAIGRAIGMANCRLAMTPANKVIFIIVTDGQENSSKEFSKDQIKTLIESLQGECKTCGAQSQNWEFVFTGANMDAVGEAVSFGITAQNAMNYVSTGDGTQAVYSALSDSVTRARSGGSAAFTDEERSANS